MGRQAKYSTDELLDVAVDLFAEGGIEATTVAAVARRAGAPSGSLYHRFQGRAALLAALWLRAVEGFQSGYLAALSRDGDPRHAAREAVTFGLEWIQQHETEARILLLHRADDFLRPGVDSATRTRAERLQSELRSGLEDFRLRLGPQVSQRRVRFALLDLPYAAVRHDLTINATPDPEIVDLVIEVLDQIL